MSAPIEVDLNTWLIMRADPVRPAAVVERVIHQDGTTRYLLYTWASHHGDRRLIGLFISLKAADDYIPPVREVQGRKDGPAGWPPGAHEWPGVGENR